MREELYIETTGITAGNIIAAIPKTQTTRKRETPDTLGERNSIPIDKIGRLNPFIPESVLIGVMDPMSGRIANQATSAREIMIAAVR